ncbi:protein NUCLEAR FUSION DEFECTIVE 4-like [Argentina anserina]|uniref:protein NUCLEAR FUSION DEFECTIVE 4-like n=1 Tax=Argentina anserina TaxID=57926 RepID=UPI0021766FFB|nr:protein NUCLEAR FUSION DEFECTIVE 4-like [Potentilla anserina]
MFPLEFPTSPAKKWMGLVTAIWVQAVCGNNYTFSNYSHALKTLMALTQLQLNNLSVAKDIGKAFGLISGMASDRLSTSTILMIGSLEGLIGYGVQWLVVSRRINPLPYWQMCIFLCMGGNSTTWMNTAVLVTCMRNFTKNRGPVSGILKGYVGLSTAIFTDLCTSLFSSSPSKFLLMLAIVPAIVCIAACIFLQETPPASSLSEEKQEAEVFHIFNVLAIVVAVYLLAFDISGPHGHVLSLAFAIGLIVLLAMPLGVPLYSFLCTSRSYNFDIEHKTLEDPLVVQEALLEQSKELAGVQVADFEGSMQRPSIGEDHNIFQMIQTFDFWVLFGSFLCGTGTAMCVMNNMAQMGMALGYSSVSIFISLLSIWGFFGRIVSGVISEYYIGKHAMPRPFWNAIAEILMALGYLAMALAMPGSLYIGSIFVGLGYGFLLTITVPVASELFGLKYYGLLYNILIINLPLGSFLFSGLLAGYLYDAEATKTSEGGSTCVGSHCYRLVNLIMALASILGLVLDVLLAVRTKKVYTKIYEIKNQKKVLGFAASSN